MEGKNRNKEQRQKINGNEYSSYYSDYINSNFEFQLLKCTN